MRDLARGLVLAMAIACGGPDEGTFKTDYSSLWCDLVLTCTDEAALVFDGILDRDDCLAAVGPELDAWGEGCKYKKGRGRKCLNALEALTCPADDDLESIAPLPCDTVFVKCSGAEPQPTGNDDTAT